MVFFWGAYGSLPDATIWWCLQTGGGGVLTRKRCLSQVTLLAVPGHRGLSSPSRDSWESTPVAVECEPAPLVPQVGHILEHEVAVQLVEAISGIEES